jgi:Flp pilus assembly protein TadD
MGQITAPPSFEDNRTFRTGAPAAPLDSSHVSSQREEISLNLLRLLKSYDLAAASAQEKSSFESACAMLDQRMVNASAEAFRAASASHPKSRPLRTGLAAALFLKGEQTESAALLLKLAAEAPADPRLLPFLGEAAAMAENEKPAVIEALRRMKDAQPQSGAARYYLARTAGGPEAQRLYLEAARLDAADARPCIELARADTSEGRLDSAVDWLTQALARDPKSAEAHYLLGRLYHRTGRRDLGDKHLEQFRALKQR